MPNEATTDIWTLSDLATPWCVHIVATLRIAEHMAAGIEGIDELASASGTVAEPLLRVLRHLAGKGMFNELSPGRFGLNETARSLLDPGARLGLNLDGFGGRMAGAWGSLLTALRTGAPAYHTIYGLPFWEDLQAHPDIAEDFDALMGPGHGVPDPEVLPGGNWESINTVVDVGGGTGTLLAEVLGARPHLRGVLVELPSVVARSGEIFRAAGVSERVTTVGQSFFEPLPAGHDLYLLKSVLSNWPDAEAITILKRCADAARPAGRVVLLNGVLPDEDGPAPPNLLMLVLVGGKDRTLTEFRALAGKAGLEVRTAVRQASGCFLVECCVSS